MSALPPLSEIPEAMLKDYMKKLFAIGDVNGDGVLSPTEFAEAPSAPNNLMGLQSRPSLTGFK